MPLLGMLQLANAVHVVNYIKTINNNTAAATTTTTTRCWKMAFHWMGNKDKFGPLSRAITTIIHFVLKFAYHCHAFEKYGNSSVRPNECNLLLIEVTNRTSANIYCVAPCTHAHRAFNVHGRQSRTVFKLVNRLCLWRRATRRMLNTI